MTTARAGTHDPDRTIATPLTHPGTRAGQGGGPGGTSATTTNPTANQTTHTTITPPPNPRTHTTTTQQPDTQAAQHPHPQTRTHVPHPPNRPGSRGRTVTATPWPNHPPSQTPQDTPRQARHQPHPRQQPGTRSHDKQVPFSRKDGGDRREDAGTPPAAPPPFPCANLSGLCGSLSNFSVARRPGSGACPNLRIRTRSTLNCSRIRVSDLRGH